jgi:hypothetical protein
MLLQGLRIDASQEEAVQFVLAHAEGDGLQVEFVARWIEARLAEA